MQNVLVIAVFLILSGCGDKKDNRFDLVSQNFSRSEAENYSEKLSGKGNSSEANQNKEGKNSKSRVKDKEPLPEFNAAEQFKAGFTKSFPEKNAKNSEGESTGFFSKFSGWFGSDEKKDADITTCQEMLDLNKTIITEQNKKIAKLNSEKNQFENRIGELERKLKQKSRGDSQKILELESELMQLKKLVEILSSEIK